MSKVFYLPRNSISLLNERLNFLMLEIEKICYTTRYNENLQTKLLIKRSTPKRSGRNLPWMPLQALLVERLWCAVSTT